MKAIRLASLVLIILSLGPRALASGPSGFWRPQIYIHPHVRTGHFMGPLSEMAGWGIGVGLTQGLQLGYWGLNATIDTDYFITTEQAIPPPFNRGLQVASIQLAGRFSYPLGDFWPFAELHASRISLISNSLVSLTGPGLSTHSLGGGLGLRLFQLAPVYLELQACWDYWVDPRETSVLSFNLAFGFRSIL